MGARSQSVQCVPEVRILWEATPGGTRWGGRAEPKRGGATGQLGAHPRADAVNAGVGARPRAEAGKEARPQGTEGRSFLISTYSVFLAVRALCGHRGGGGGPGPMQYIIYQIYILRQNTARWVGPWRRVHPRNPIGEGD